MKKKDMNFYQAQRKYNLPRLGDADGDDFPNWLDCAPYNPNRDGIFGRAVGVVSHGKYGQTKEEYEKEKVAKAQVRLDVNKMPREPVYRKEDEYTSKADLEKGLEEVDVKLRKEQVTSKRKTEPYVLYIKHSLTDPYIMVGQFDSSFEAQRYLDENYKGFAHKIMSVKDAIREGERQEERKRKRKEMVTKTAKTVISGIETIGRGAVAVGKGAAKATEALGEVEEKYKEYWESRDIKAVERETRELERLRKANKRMAIRLEQQQVRAKQRAKAEQLRGELQEKEQPTRGFGFQQPGRQSGFTFSPPSPLTPQRALSDQQRSFGAPAQRPAGFAFHAPRDIRWKPPQALAPSQVQPKPKPVKKKKKPKKKKAKKKSKGKK